MFDYIDKFGFGKKTGIDLNGEGTGIIFNRDKIGPVELATTAFGQGVSVTPIQQITAVSAAINGGKLYRPYIVKSLNEPELNSVIKENKPQFIRRVISEETSKQVRYALESVVSNGTGRTAYIDGYRVGGKTGTAQKVENGRYMVGNYITSFMGFMPADNPEIVVYVAIDNAKGVTQYGGTIVGPIVRNILIDAIDILNIKRRDGGMEKEYNYNDLKYIEVPDVVGLSTKEASKLLRKFKIQYSGTGSSVKIQAPIGGVRIQEGSNIRLFLTE